MDLWLGQFWGRSHLHVTILLIESDAIQPKVGRKDAVCSVKALKCIAVVPSTVSACKGSTRTSHVVIPLVCSTVHTIIRTFELCHGHITWHCDSRIIGSKRSKVKLYISSQIRPVSLICGLVGRWKLVPDLFNLQRQRKFDTIWAASNSHLVVEIEIVWRSTSTRNIWATEAEVRIALRLHLMLSIFVSFWRTHQWRSLYSRHQTPLYLGVGVVLASHVAVMDSAEILFLPGLQTFPCSF